MNRPSSPFGPLSTVMLIARRAGNVVATYQAAFPAKGTADREESIFFLRQWRAEHAAARGYTIRRVRAR